jgi:3-phosphoshikimate 1-carboxyvinyltransferase
MNLGGASRQITPMLWPADATILVPGSKSEANRLLVAAAMSGERVLVRGATACDDVRYLVQGLAKMGFEAFFVDEQTGVVQVGPRPKNATAHATIFCGNAGTALRFLVSVAAVTPGEWTITGDEHMLRRPVGPLCDAWRQLGIEVTATAGRPPVRVRGGTPIACSVTLDASISSQFVSSMLLVAGTLPRGLQIEFASPTASMEYAQLTGTMLHQFGIEVELHDHGATAFRGKGGAPREVHATGDWSAMGAWTCLEFLTGSRIAAPNLRTDSGQADEQLATLLQALSGHGERTIDVSHVPDQFLNLAIVAALRPGITRLTGAANLRHKECDRIAVMARELGKCGIRSEELHDGLHVHGGTALHGAKIDPERDHRVAMAFALLGLLVPGITIADPDCVAKSYPTFWPDVDAVHAAARCVTVLGMRCAGKSTFAHALADATGRTWVDSDDLFVALHGPIAAFVAEHGWHAFRAEEARLIADALRPGHILSTGGGALEHAPTRELLRTRSLPIWLDGPAELLRERLRNDPASRPSITGAPVGDELPTLVARRNPMYAECAALRLNAALPTSQQVTQALHLLGVPCRFPRAAHARP